MPDFGKCDLCGGRGTMNDPCASFWDPTKPPGEEQVEAHGECGFDAGLEMA